MLIGPEKSLGDEQSRMNQSTRGQWDWYASHRRAIENLIVPERRGGKICVLGAGNCNDLDLKWLAEVYGEVHLVDIDPWAPERAIVRQGVSREKVVCHAPVDLTGVAEMTKGWKGREVSAGEVQGAVHAAGQLDLSPLGDGYDTVLSPCVLSQLLVSVRDVLGKRHPGWPGLKAAIRERHLRTVAALVKTGGKGVVVVDLASTRTVKELDRAKEHELPGLMRMCLSEGKCFRGLEPAAISAEFGGARIGVADIAVSGPWLWHLGWGKAFLCYGLVARRDA